MARALLFPGQGSQSIGMGKDLANAYPEANEVFAQVDAALGEHLTQIMWDGPEDALRLTRNAQPALMAHSIATLRVLEKRAGLEVAHSLCVAGHSLGEYAALCAAGVLSLQDTARLLRVRGDAMQAAVAVGEGAMAAIIGLDLDQVQQALTQTERTLGEGESCEIANDNAPDQLVISGTCAGVEAAMEKVQQMGAKRVVPLPVSAPFHSRLMAPAAERMTAALAAICFQAPCVPVVANVTATFETAPDRLRDLLVAQVTGRVCWTQSVQKMADAHAFLEIGTGRVLSGLVRRVHRKAETFALGTLDNVAAFIAQ